MEAVLEKVPELAPYTFTVLGGPRSVTFTDQPVLCKIFGSPEWSGPNWVLEGVPNPDSRTVELLTVSLTFLPELSHPAVLPNFLESQTLPD
jgi:hypothetical protein